MDTSKYCRHFNGLINNFCKAGIGYESVRLNKGIPCFATGGKECESYQPYSPEELESKNKARDRFVNLLSKGLSDCCEAPIDQSQVISDGRYKGHGRMFCSKCKRVVFVV